MSASGSIKLSSGLNDESDLTELLQNYAMESVSAHNLIEKKRVRGDTV